MPKYMRKNMRNKIPEYIPNKIPEDISIIKYIDVIVEIMRNKLNLLNIYIKYKNQGNFV